MVTKSSKSTTNNKDRTNTEDLPASNPETNLPANAISTGTCSRLFVKNLPGLGATKNNKWDEPRLRAMFEKFGKVTDVQLKFSEKTGAGKFAFVGFESADSCAQAIAKLNGTFLKGTKLQVEPCRPLSADRKEITKKFTLSKLSKANDSQTNLNPSTLDRVMEEQIMDTGRLFLRNLSYECREAQLEQLFLPFGPLAELDCIIDRQGRCKGFAMCTFMFPEHAVSAWKALDGQIFMGRLLHIIAGNEKQKKPIDPNSSTHQAMSSFQQERLSARRQESGASANTSTSTPHTWNALFLGSNAVAEALAESYELEKRHLLMDEGENSAAVRMAMAETRLVRETRKFLLEHGVKLDAFTGQNVKRSKTIILVKNLSGRAGEGARLRALFGRHGKVKELIVPPAHGISALVEMASELDAKKAFEALAYARSADDGTSDGRPLYLEWAPMDAIGGKTPKNELKVEEEASKEGEEAVDAEAGGKADKKEPERTKLLVRNVPFQTNLKELTQLFSAFGELKFLRMPKKPGGEGHRGFCFVDFISAGDASRAFQALAHSTHLYGRRLVLEWAKQGEESVEELRQKSRDRVRHGIVGTESGGGMKKRTKMRSFEVEE